jgi:UPF0716 protein FxsA
MAMALLVVFFILLPIAELYVIIQVGQWIGLLPTLAILVLDGFVGAALARSQGQTAWERFNRALSDGRVPAKETADGAMIILGGALLLTPGFITDVFGFALLIPPTRALLRGGLSRLARRRMSFGWTVASPPPRPWSYGTPHAQPGETPTRRRARSYDVEGTAHEVTDPPDELPRGSSDG